MVADGGDGDLEGEMVLLRSMVIWRVEMVVDGGYGGWRWRWWLLESMQRRCRRILDRSMQRGLIRFD
jgi:hypothetical protein